MTKTEHYYQCTDKEIIKKILNGEIILFEIIIRRNNPFLYKAGRSYGYNHADTEDLMQETYLSAFKNLKKFEHRSSIKTWLLKIMINQCYHKKQKFSFQKEVLTADYIQNSTPMFHDNDTHFDKVFANKELASILENSIQKLPEDYRLVFALRELTGLNTAETSVVLKITESNVKVRLNRAKKMLRANLEKVYTSTEIYEFNLIYCDEIVKDVMEKLNPKGPSEATGH